MSQEVRTWVVDNKDRLVEVPRSTLSLENRLEEWIAGDISILSPDLLVFGRQVETDHGGIIDFLCLDEQGNVVVIELRAQFAWSSS